MHNIKPSIMTVNEILKKKGNEVHSIPSTITVYEALRIMGERNVGAVLVIEDDNLKGILSERDYARKIVLKNKASKDTFVHEIMDKEIVSVKPTDDLDYCMDLITNKRVRHLPVLLEEKVVGIISIGDVVKSIIELQKNTIDHLDSYIHGTKA
jgi:CBS domain-containing protein